LLSGLFDPASFFGGELSIDVDRARKAITENIAAPLNLSPEDAAIAMEQAWVSTVANELTNIANITDDTILAAFGGAGPMLSCKVAEAAGISRIVIPGLAAVFSAYGLGFSDIAHQYDAALNTIDDLEGCLQSLNKRALRGMRAEGFDLEECEIEKTLHVSESGRDDTVALNGAIPTGVSGTAQLSISMQVSKSIPRPECRGEFGKGSKPAIANGSRRLLIDGKTGDYPVYRVEEQPAGASATGPAVLEEAYFSCRVDPGWSFEVNDNRDILLQRV
jgi:N-methylhydantoinase A/oxoprolinase/acetone carboxylase beta subunit